MSRRPYLFGNRLGVRASAMPGPGLLIPSAPVFTSSSMTGGFKDGEVATANWTASGFTPISAAYQWKRNLVPIDGAISQTLLFDAATDGWVGEDDIQCDITLTNMIGEVTQTVTGQYAPPSLIDTSDMSLHRAVANSELIDADSFQFYRNGGDIGDIRFTLAPGNYRVTADISAETLSGLGLGIQFRMMDTGTQLFSHTSAGTGVTFDITTTTSDIRMLNGGNLGCRIDNFYLEAL